MTEGMIILLFTIVVAMGLVGWFIFWVTIIRLQNKVDGLDKMVAGMTCYLAELRKRDILPPLHECNEDDR